MDTITQIALGSAVGEAFLGKKIGHKAPLWGAVFGILPDLDILASPFVNEVQALALHRSFTHSLLFMVIASPLFGWMLHRYYSQEKVSWRQWSFLVLFVLATHVFIDLCTSYGTQILHPFTDVPYALNSIFIIDPFYTLPLVVGLIFALRKKRNSSARRWANNLGLIISSIYLLAGLGLKTHVNDVFEQNFEREQISPQQYMTTPAPLSIFLWTGYAVEGDTLYAGLYSVFDHDQHIDFQAVPQNEELIAPYRNQTPVERVIWFSRGYYAVEKEEHFRLYDLRFGRSDLWISDDPARYIRKYDLEFNADSTRVTGFEEEFAGFDNQMDLLQNLFIRTIGRVPD